ncbi:MAG: amidase family protein [Thalassobaculales bacterium]
MPADMSLIRLTAVEAVAKLKAGEVSPLDLIDAAAARIAEVEPAVNALPTLCLDRARDRAAAAGRDSLLAGLPLAIKDLTAVEGVRTTHGSPIFKDHVPAHSDAVVRRLEDNGGLVIAKSNTPEFGAGANTFNEVFGATRNPWDTRMSAAGSSGGAAVALATGTVWLAHGSDTGGSLRTPAAFNGVVGLRPSPGRVVRGPRGLPFATLPVDGPMGRTVADTALMLDAMVGLDAEDPLAMEAPEYSFLAAVRQARPPRRVAWSRDLGITVTDPEVAAICEAAARRFEEMGAVVEEAAPDLHDVHDIFQVQRAAHFAAAFMTHLEQRREMLKPEMVWNVEKGLKLTAAEIGRAELARAALVRRAFKFMQGYDLLVCPTAIVPPYPVEERYVARVGDHAFETYIDWIAITYAVTVTALPAVSIPAGLTAGGLPVGLQIVGQPRGEAGLLAAASLLEQALGNARATPIDPVLRHR